MTGAKSEMQERRVKLPHVEVERTLLDWIDDPAFQSDLLQ